MSILWMKNIVGENNMKLSDKIRIIRKSPYLFPGRGRDIDK